MTRSSIVLTIFIFLFFNACVPMMIYDHQKKKEAEATINFVKNSYLEKYSTKATIGKVMRKVSNNRIEWAGDEKSASCRILIQYPDPYTYHTRNLILGIFFDYDFKTRKTSVRKIWEIQTGRLYSEPVGIHYVLNTIYKKYENLK